MLTMYALFYDFSRAQPMLERDLAIGSAVRPSVRMSVTSLYYALYTWGYPVVKIRFSSPASPGL